MMRETMNSNDPTDRQFCKLCRNEIARRKPQSSSPMTTGVISDYEYLRPKVDRLEAENANLRGVVRDLLESYLATFGGNKDELAFRAERLLKE